MTQCTINIERYIKNRLESWKNDVDHPTWDAFMLDILDLIEKNADA